MSVGFNLNMKYTRLGLIWDRELWDLSISIIIINIQNIEWHSTM